MGNKSKTDLSDVKAVDQMYRKIWGLKELEKIGFPIPPYQVIDFSGKDSVKLNDYLIDKIEKVKVLNSPGNAIGVTIRVSMPGDLDKIAKHGGLHVTDKDEILKRVIERHNKYGTTSRIIIQHTVDAKCSGTILKEDGCCIVEAIPEDAPPLLEGHSTNYEKWVFSSRSGLWRKEKVYVANDQEFPVLTQDNLRILEKYVKLLPSNVYLEWSISKHDKLFFYEYCKLE